MSNKNPITNNNKNKYDDDMEIMQTNNICINNNSNSQCSKTSRRRKRYTPNNKPHINNHNNNNMQPPTKRRRINNNTSLHSTPKTRKRTNPYAQKISPNYQPKNKKRRIQNHKRKREYNHPIIKCTNPKRAQSNINFCGPDHNINYQNDCIHCINQLPKCQKRKGRKNKWRKK